VIKENIPIKNNSKKIVTRICDECGKEEKALLSCIWKGRRLRQKDIDVCKSCSYKEKYRKSVFRQNMEKSLNWKGGKSTNSGYSRIYLGHQKRKYEHIYEKHINRELIGKECLHHVDLVKTNNEINNLYLCKNRKEHFECHVTAEDCGFALMGSRIWFDRTQEQYVTEYIQIPKFVVDISEFDCYSIHTRRIIGRRRCKRKYRSYLFYYLGYQKYKMVHIAVAEKMIGRRIYKNENVHHIDGNTLNNEPSNLIILTQRQHQKAHRSLQACVIDLYRTGVVDFNHQTGEYYVI